MNMLKRLLTALILPPLIFFLYSCGIDLPEVTTKLRTPMGLVVYSSNDSFVLEWWGYNNEDYFSGYVIFISEDYQKIADPSKPITEKPKILNPSGSLPTISLQPTTEPTKYTAVLPITTIADDKGNRFFPNFQYYFSVAAYSSSKGIFSPLSNITNGIVSNQ
jgi:hypothetical protein